MKFINKKIILAFLTLLIIIASYFLGEKRGSTNIPINSNNRQYRDIYARQVIINEKGQVFMSGTAQEQATGNSVNWNAQGYLRVEK